MNKYFLPIIYIIIIIFLIGLFFGSFFSVSCKISLPNDEIYEGDKTVIVYEIDNRLLFDDILNVEFDYWVSQGNENKIPVDTIKIDKISRFDKNISAVEIDTSDLSKGKYTIWTQTTYSIGTGGQGIGNRESKILSLNIYII